MKNYKITILSLLFLVLNTMCLYGQEAIPTTGGEATGAGGTVSYTIGQILYNTYNSTGYSEAQGVQQPYEISTVLSLPKQEGISLTCKVYPNPSENYLILKVDNSVLKDLQYHLYDVSGKLLKNESVQYNTTTINMADFVPAIYLLQVISASNTIQSFKIIKN